MSIDRSELWEMANKHRRDYCEACLSKENLQLHHIMRRLPCNWAERWNLITLCYECHFMIHHYGKERFLNEYDFLKPRFERAKELEGKRCLKNV